MRIENVSLPYPVLGISDDIRPTLEETGCSNPDITIEEDGKNFRVLRRKPSRPANRKEYHFH